MKRWVWAAVCVVLGLGMLACGLLVPMHLRVVDASVLERAGRTTPGLIERGLALADQKNLGAARILLQTADQTAIGRERLTTAVAALAAARAGGVLGGEEPLLQRLFAQTVATNAEPFTDLVIRQENRGPVMDYLRSSKRPEVRELVRCRVLTNTVFFPPSTSTSGQAFDAALSVCGLLLDEGKLTPGMSNAFWTAAAQALGEIGLVMTPNGTTEAMRSPTQPLEEMLVDTMSLGQRMNWGQLEVFMGQIPDARALRRLAGLSRVAGRQMPVLFSAVAVSGRPGDVAAYLVNFGPEGLTDLEAGMRCGAGGLKELLSRNQRWYQSAFRQRVVTYPPLDLFYLAAADYAWLMPQLALAIKWLLYLGAGCLLAAAAHFCRPAVPAIERSLQVRGFHIAREVLFGLGFLVVVVLASEPSLSQSSPKAEFPFRLHLPIVGGAAPAVLANATSTNMNPSILTLLLFFVIQGLIYTSCLVKLAEIRRQRVPARIKLKLLDNEDHLFDAGLYVGFAGTIISLILISQNVIKQPSLMAAYSSTSFGIIFVVIFKIFNLRPLRRRYLLEAETMSSQPAMSQPAAAPRAPAPVTPS